MTQTYRQHVATLLARYEEALLLQGDVDGVLIHSGFDRYYYSDDQAVPFRSYGHFAHWLGVERPDQLLLIRPGRRPVYFRVVAQDYWHDQEIAMENHWLDEFDVVTLAQSSAVTKHLDECRRLAFIGEDTGFAEQSGVDQALINPQRFLNRIDFFRAYKTDYEIEQIRAANRLALQGHEAARDSFLSGGSEYDIHMAYLAACSVTEFECPYTNIVALNEKAAILHYQHKRRRQDMAAGHRNQVLLIDAGCRVNAYCSDITRTTAAPDAHPVFRSLVDAVEAAELKLTELVEDGLAYPKLHDCALSFIAAILLEHELVTLPVEEAVSNGLAGVFMPHGVGHLLGIQVHDVGGQLQDAEGRRLPPPDDAPFLRNTRTMACNMVFTVEPGLYFIPMLLNRIRDNKQGRSVNWKLIDELVPLGGIRSEDNVLVTAEGAVNLTRG